MTHHTWGGATGYIERSSIRLDGTYNWFARNDCRLCSGHLEQVIDFGKVALANDLRTAAQVSAEQIYPQKRYPLYLSRCVTCGHVQLPVVVDPEILFSSYRYMSGVGASFRAHLLSLAAELKTRALSSRVPIVELGSNDGTFLSACRAEGIPCIGVDPALNLAAQASAVGRLTVPAFFGIEQAKALRLLLGRDATVVGLNVFAHADRLDQIAAAASELIGSTGSFVVEVGYLLDIIRTNNFPVVYHEHLSQHSLRPLVPFFAGLRMRMYDAERINTQGGSVRIFVDRGARKPTDRLQLMLDGEASLASELAEWPAHVESSAVALRDMVRGLKVEGKRVAGYGASAKSTTLLNRAGLGREDIDFICDSNPMKVGMFSPGTHIPVVATSELDARQPDYCVSLSGNFSEAFRARHPEYRGQWIEPLPMPEVL